MTSPLPIEKETYRLAARLLRVFQSVSEYTQEQTPDDVIAQLSVNQLRALNFIRREPGISQKALAEKLNVTSATVSIWIARMLDARLVEKHPHEHDARVMRLYLGSVGQQLVRTVEQRHVEVIADLLYGMSPDEQRMIVKALENALARRLQAKQGETA